LSFFYNFYYLFKKCLGCNYFHYTFLWIWTKHKILRLLIPIMIFAIFSGGHEKWYLFANFEAKRASNRAKKHKIVFHRHVLEFILAPISIYSPPFHFFKKHQKRCTLMWVVILILVTRVEGELAVYNNTRGAL